MQKIIIFGKNHTIDVDKAVLRLKCGNSWSLELLRFFTKKRIEAAGIVRHALMPPDVLVGDGDEEELDQLSSEMRRSSIGSRFLLVEIWGGRKLNALSTFQDVNAKSHSCHFAFKNRAYLSTHSVGS